jgi:hypothetical protein
MRGWSIREKYREADRASCAKSNSCRRTSETRRRQPIARRRLSQTGRMNSRACRQTAGAYRRVAGPCRRVPGACRRPAGACRRVALARRRSDTPQGCRDALTLRAESFAPEMGLLPRQRAVHPGRRGTGGNEPDPSPRWRRPAQRQPCELQRKRVMHPWPRDAGDNRLFPRSCRSSVVRVG